MIKMGYGSKIKWKRITIQIPTINILPIIIRKGQFEFKVSEYNSYGRKPRYFTYRGQFGHKIWMFQWWAISASIASKKPIEYS